jgi:hypothetical protein
MRQLGLSYTPGCPKIQPQDWAHLMPDSLASSSQYYCSAEMNVYTFLFFKKILQKFFSLVVKMFTENEDNFQK